MKYRPIRTPTAVTTAPSFNQPSQVAALTILLPAPLSGLGGGAVGLGCLNPPVTRFSRRRGAGVLTHLWLQQEHAHRRPFLHAIPHRAAARVRDRPTCYWSGPQVVPEPEVVQCGLAAGRGEFSPHNLTRRDAYVGCDLGDGQQCGVAVLSRGSRRAPDGHGRDGHCGAVVFRTDLTIHRAALLFSTATYSGIR